MARKLARRPQRGKQSGFGSLCWIGSRARWVVKWYAKRPDGGVSRPYIHVFDAEVQTRGQAEYAFGQWLEQQKREQALHLRLPAGDVRTLCREFVSRGIELYRRGDKIASYWGFDKATADQWANMQGDLRLSEYDGDHFRAFRDALDRMAAGPQSKGKRSVSTREGVNKKLKAVRRIVKWGVSCKLCQPSLLDILKSVKGLAVGEARARDGKGREACTIEQVEATYPYLPPAAQSAVWLLRWSGARPSEVLSLRVDELELLDTDPPMYCAVKRDHKNAKKGKARTVFFAPVVTEDITALLAACTKADQFLFSKARMVASGEAENVREVEKASGHLCAEALADLVEVAADLAGVEHWTPYQLCHLREDEINAALGIEYAQAARNHSTATMTANYTKRSTDQKMRRMAMAGAMVGVE